MRHSTFNVTRFGSMAKKIFHLFECLFSFGQNLEPTLAKFNTIGQIFIIKNGHKLSKQSSHLVTLASNLDGIFPPADAIHQALDVAWKSHQVE